MSLPQTIIPNEFQLQTNESKVSVQLLDMNLIDEDFSLPREPPKPVPLNSTPILNYFNLEQTQNSSSKISQCTQTNKHYKKNESSETAFRGIQNRTYSKKSSKIIGQDQKENSQCEKKKISNKQIQMLIYRFSQDFVRRQQKQQIIEQEKIIKEKQEEESFLIQVKNSPKMSKQQAKKLTERLLDDAAKRISMKEKLEKEKQQEELNCAIKLSKTKHLSPKSQKIVKNLSQEPVYDRLTKDADFRMQKQMLTQETVDKLIRMQSVPNVSCKGTQSQQKLNIGLVGGQ